MSRRILHIIDSLEPTGTARQLLWLAQGLAGQGSEVQVCALARGGALADEYRAAGLAVAELGRRWRVDPFAYRRLARLVAELRPDVVHTWDHMSGVYGRLAARAAGGSPRRSPVGGVSVGGVSDADSAQPAGSRHPHPRPLSPGERGGWRPALVVGVPRVDPWRGPLGWLVERRLAPAADRFVVPHDAVREWCIAHGLPEERITVMPGGVPPARESDVSRDELLAELGLPADARLIGMIERLGPDSLVKDAIWAADLVRVLHDNLRLLVIGDGPGRPQLERFARLASDLEHIHFLGERRDLWRIVPHLDLLWNGSRYVGHATVVMQAMAASVPVMISDVPGHRELVVHGESGVLVPIGDRAARARATDRLLTNAALSPGLPAAARATEQFLVDDAVAARIGAAARERVRQRFNIERFVQRHLELYERLAN